MKHFVMQMIWNAINWLTKHNVGSLDAYHTQVNWYQESDYLKQPFWRGTQQLFSYWSPIGSHPVWKWRMTLPMAIADILNLRFWAKHPDDVPFYNVKPSMFVHIVGSLFIWLWSKGIGLNCPSLNLEHHTYRRYGMRVWLKAFLTRHPLTVIMTDAKDMIYASITGAHASWWHGVQTHRVTYNNASSNDFMWGGDERTKQRVKAMFAEEEILNRAQVNAVCKHNRCLGTDCNDDDCECVCHNEDGDYYDEWNANFHKDVGLR